MSLFQPTSDVKASAVIFATTSIVLVADTLQGKGRAQTPDLNGSLVTSTPSRLPRTVSSLSPSRLATKALKPIDTSRSGSPLPSMPTSPIQGSKIPLRNRIPIRPIAADRSGSSPAATSSTRWPLSTGSPKAYMPSSSGGTAPSILEAYRPAAPSCSSSGTAPASSAPIAESMFTEFEYDPNDRTPPRRRTAVEDAALASSSVPNAGPSSVSCKLHVAANTEQEQAFTNTVASVPVILDANLAAYRAAIEKTKRPYDSDRDSAASISRLPYRLVAEMNPERYSLQDEIRAASLETRLKRIGEPHTRLSAITDCSVPASSVHEAGPEEGLPSTLISSASDGQDVEIAEPISTPITEPSPRSSYSSARESQNLDNVAPERSASDTPPSSLAMEVISQEQQDTEGSMPTVTDKPPISNLPRALTRPVSFAHPGGRCRSLPLMESSPCMLVPSRVPEHSRTFEERRMMGPGYARQLAMSGSSPITEQTPLSQNIVRAPHEVEERQRTQTRGSQTRPCPPEPTQKERPPSTSSRWRMDWSKVWQILAILATAMAFLCLLVVALVTMEKTKTYPAVPSDLFTASSKTIPSEDGSSNLTMSWLSGEALSFKVSSILNATMDPNEPSPDTWQFLLDWSAERVRFGPGKERDVISSMPIPSFREESVQNYGFIGFSAAVVWCIHIVLGCLSTLWQMREDEGVYWTEKWLHWFNNRKVAIAVVLTLVISPPAWAAITRAVLLR